MKLNNNMKIYTFGKGDKMRRIAWYAKVQHQAQNLRDPNVCRGCDEPVNEGDKVVSRHVKGHSHIYHLRCALKNHVV